MPPHGRRAGDAGRIDKENFGGPRWIAVVTTARSDQRCVPRLESAAKIDITASRLALIHHVCGPHVQ